MRAWVDRQNEIDEMFSGGTYNYLVTLSGESFDNEDGSSRQAEIARCYRGDSVQLVPEPSNPHDSGAVAALSSRGIKIGYVSRAYTERVRALLDGGTVEGVWIKLIAGGTNEKPWRGVVVNVRGRRRARR